MLAIASVLKDAVTNDKELSGNTLANATQDIGDLHKNATQIKNLIAKPEHTGETEKLKQAHQQLTTKFAYYLKKFDDGNIKSLQQSYLQAIGTIGL